MPEFNLVPEDIPRARRRAGVSLYTGMLDQFLEMKDRTVRVEYARKPATMYVSVKRAIGSDRKYRNVKVSMRCDGVFLVKT